MKQQKQKRTLAGFLQRQEQYKWRWLLGLGLTALVVAQLTFNGFVWLYIRSSPPRVTKIADLILDADRNATKPAVIEPVRKQVYLPEANLVLPFMPAEVSMVRYSYSPAREGEPASLLLTSQEAVNQARQKVMGAAAGTPSTSSPTSPMERMSEEVILRQIFEAVPQLQACTRGFEIEMGDTGRNEAGLERTVVALGDGRQAFIYRNKNCPYQPAAMTEYVKQVKVYKPSP